MNQAVKRRLHLKFVSYHVGRRKGFVAQPIDALAATVFQKAASMGERLWLPHGPGGTHYFLNRFRDHGATGCSFQLCSFTPGLLPTGAKPDLTKQELEIQPVVVSDPATADPVEIMTALHVLARGQILIVEGVRGGGGIHALAHCLSALIRKYVDPKYPQVHLQDVVNPDLKKAIDGGGGAVAMVLGMAEAAPDPLKGGYAELLGDAKLRVGQARKVTVRWDAVDTLDTDAVLDAFNEASDEADDLDSIILHLKSGATISGISRFKESTQVDVESKNGRVPDTGGLVLEMRQYLIRLQTPQDGYRVLTDAGTLAPGMSVADH